MHVKKDVQLNLRMELRQMHNYNGYTFGTRPIENEGHDNGVEEFEELESNETRFMV